MNIKTPLLDVIASEDLRTALRLDQSHTISDLLELHPRDVMKIEGMTWPRMVELCRIVEPIIPQGFESWAVQCMLCKQERVQAQRDEKARHKAKLRAEKIKQSIPQQSPTKIVETIKITHWLCNIDGHRHTTKDAAASCMARRGGGKAKDQRIRWGSTEKLDLVRRICCGQSKASIARDLSLSPGRVAQVFKMIAREVSEASDNAHWDGSLRTLERNKQDVVAAAEKIYQDGNK